MTEPTDECRLVEVPTADGPRAVRVHGPHGLTAEDVAYLGQIVDAAGKRTITEHPHADVIQELMLAWTRTRCELDDHNVKARMSAAIRAVRDRLDAVQAELDSTRASGTHVGWIVAQQDDCEINAHGAVIHPTREAAEVELAWVAYCAEFALYRLINDTPSPDDTAAVERMARAIQVRIWPSMVWDAIDPEEREHCRDMARAGLRAAREAP